MEVTNSTDDTGAPSVLCFGPLVLDLVTCGIDQLPKRYQAQEVDSISLSLGGGACIAAQTFRRLGEEVAVCGQVGNDFEGAHICTEMKRRGVLTDYILRSTSRTTSKSFVAIDRLGNAHYALSREAGSDQWSLPGLSSSIAADDSKKILEAVEVARHLHISSVSEYVSASGDSLIAFIEKVRSSNKELTISADISKITKTISRTDVILPHIDYLFGNEHQMRILSQKDVPYEIASHFLSHDLKGLWITLGNKGAICATAEGCVSCPGLHFEGDVNENGAGDVFCSAVMHAVRTLGIEPIQATAFGNQVASLYVYQRDILSPEQPLTPEKIREECSNARSTETVATDRPLWKSHYDYSNYVEQFDTARPIADESRDWWIKSFADEGKVTPESLVLDAGCGPGRFTFHIADKIGCRVIGIDREEESLAFAEKKRKNFPGIAEERVELIEGQLDRLQDKLASRSGSIDAVWMSSAMSHNRDTLSGVFDQIHSVLKPGGRLIIRELTAELAPRLEWYDHFPEAKEYVERRYIPLSTAMKLLVESGFVIHLAHFHEDFEEIESVEVLASRYQCSAFSWRSVYDEIPDVFESNLKRMCDAFGAGTISAFQGKYLIVAERIQGKQD
ncbi:MAG: PfkB family carbohydrate kinase [Cyanobacteria bacterium P01_D01_bin.115]